MSGGSAAGPLVVGAALSNRPWRGVLQRHCRDHVAGLVVHLLRDSGAALAGEVDVVVLDDDTSWLSAPFITAARERDIAVIGLYDPAEADGHGRRHLKRLGVDAVHPSTMDMEDLVELVLAARPDRELTDRFTEVITGVDQRVPLGERRLIAVGGPAGSGVTEVAVALAGCLGPRSLLIDLDETHPSVARRLGLGVHPHVVTAIDTLRRERVGLDGIDQHRLEDCLARGAVASAVALPFDTIVGLASRDDWSLLRPDDVMLLLDALTARWSTVVARVGPQLEDLSRWVDRFGASRAAVGSASATVGVCDGSASGVLRFVDWLVDAVSLVDDAPIHVIVNRAPRSAIARAQVIDQLRAIAGPRISTIAVAGHDKRVERAGWDAALVGRGRFLRAVRGLSSVLHDAAGVAVPPAATDGIDAEVAA